MKAKTTQIRPCKEKGKFAADCDLDVNIDLRGALQKIKTKKFDSIDFSYELGVIKLSKGDTAIIIFKSGRITIRRAKTKKELEDLLETLKKVLKPYFKDKY